MCFVIHGYLYRAVKGSLHRDLTDMDLGYILAIDCGPYLVVALGKDDGLEPCATHDLIEAEMRYQHWQKHLAEDESQAIFERML